MGMIKDVIFNYVCIKNPQLKKDMKADPQIPHLNKEYLITVLPPYATFRKFKKQYSNVALIKNAKSYSAEAYKETFKVDAPDAEIYGDEDGDFNVIKIKQSAYWSKSGDPTEPPGVIGKTKIVVDGEVLGYKDENGLKVSGNIEVGNGSEGVVKFRERTFPAGKDYPAGLTLDLVKIQVLKLVVYDRPETEDDNDDDFDVEEEVANESDASVGGDDEKDNSAADTSGTADSASGW